jgi:mono/diheme cytochrome c family protein
MVAGCGDSTHGVAATAQLTALAAPSAVQATGGINEVALVWQPVAGAASYNVYWSSSPGVTPSNGTKIAGVASPFHHSGLTVSQTYYYVVTALGPAGEGAPSEQAATVSATDGANLYLLYCAGCHGPVQATTIKEGMPEQIRAAITANTGGMGSLSSLTSGQIGLIAQQLPCH